jgi:cysteine desulfurase
MTYLDYAATTPVLPEVRETMISVLEGDFGNPASVHAYGRRAREIVEDARDQVAAAIGASPSEVVFTGSGTEANNLAIKGAAIKLRGNGNHIVVSAFEHHAVLDAAHALEKQGFEVTEVPVGADGLIDPAVVADSVRPSTILVSIMAVNNEIGTVQNVTAIARAVREVNSNTLVHTDAVQVLGNIPVDVYAGEVHLASFSAHKLGGPKGVGALFVKAHTPLEAQLHGGGQERGLRSGTLNVPSIAGFGVAAEVAAREVNEKVERVTALRDELLEGVRDGIPDAVVNGSLERRLCGNVNISIPGTEGETLLLLLDQAGIACSSGSACSSGALDPSHVLLAIGVDKDLAKGSLRFSLGRESTHEDVEAVVEALPEVVRIARRAA